MTKQHVKLFAKSGTRSALSLRAQRWIGMQPVNHIMKKIREIPESEEPLGIIISRGDRAEQRPIFSAYIWGPAPEPDAEPTSKVA